MKKILTFMFAAALLASCQQEENETTTIDTNGRITIAPIITRATEVDFEDTDQIGVTITQSNDFVYASNKLMTYNNGVFTGDLLWYPEGNDKSQIVAYYPYDAAGAPTSFTVKADQTDQATGYGASDLIAASKSDVLPSTNAVVMNFKHILTKLVINVENDTQSDISSVVLKGSVPTATLDLPALSVTADESATATNITAQVVKANETYRAIVIPQTVAFTLEVATADGKTLSQRLTSTTLAQGGQYSVNARVLPDDIIVTLSGKIESWTDEGEIGTDNEVPFEEHLDENYFLYDGVKYNIVTLANGTTWMAEPLAYLPKGYTPSTDPTADSHIWYPYEIVDGATVATTEESAIKELGYLYDLQAALGGKEITESNLNSFEGAQGICPKGWHIPTRLEYFNLVGKSTNDADGKVPADGDKALFYDAAYDGGKIASLNEAGFNYQFSGVRMASNFAATPSYQKTVISSTTSTKSEWFGKPSVNYYMTSTAYKAAYNASEELTNIQFFTLMSTFTLAKYPEGRLSLSYVGIKSGMQLRCVRD
ncbi:fimbrillin family protein [Bacteroides sp. RTP21281st1_E4_RTP21281_210402]|uniref:fimbrillin family protein n=1 Tax=unclassified Bacteroides TaxID=2646097 RepID=UPI0034A4C899